MIKMKTEGYSGFVVERVVYYQDDHGEVWSEINYDIQENREHVVDI